MRARSTELLAASWVGGKLENRVAQGVPIAGVDENSSRFVDELFRSAHSTGNYRQPRRHRLEHGVRHSLDVRREREHVGRREISRYIAGPGANNHAGWRRVQVDRFVEPGLPTRTSVGRAPASGPRHAETRSATPFSCSRRPR